MLANKSEVNNHVQMLDVCKMCPSDEMVDDYQELCDDLMAVKIRLIVEIRLVEERLGLNSIVYHENKLNHSFEEKKQEIYFNEKIIEILQKVDFLIDNRLIMDCFHVVEECIVLIIEHTR